MNIYWIPSPRLTRSSPLQLFSHPQRGSATSTTKPASPHMCLPFHPALQTPQTTQHEHQQPSLPPSLFPSRTILSPIQQPGDNYNSPQPPCQKAKPQPIRRTLSILPADHTTSQTGYPCPSDRQPKEMALHSLKHTKDLVARIGGPDSLTKLLLMLWRIHVAGLT